MATLLRLNAAFVAVLLFLSSANAQATQCAPDGSPQLRFVAQLSVRGCVLFVHDTGANDGPHLAVEPVMCVTESLHNVTPRYDPVIRQLFVSVPVMLRDDAMLAEVQRQLRHLSPKSVKFATVSDISVSTFISVSSNYKALEFIWSPDEAVGFLRVGCKSVDGTCIKRLFGSQILASRALDQVSLSANVTSNGTDMQLQYRPTIQNRSFYDPDFHIGRYNCLPECENLRFVRSVRLSNCVARVHERLGMEGHFLIEPLLCHNVTSMSNETVMYDYSRDMYYLNLDVVLQDDMATVAVRTQLADLSPRSVTFMRLWRAQSHVASALNRSFLIGPLMVSDDGRSAQLRVYCGNRIGCRMMRSTVLAEPVDFWKYVRYSLTSLTPDECILKSSVPKHPWRLKERGGVYKADSDSPVFRNPDGRWFITMQQRKTGNVSFQRNWIDYEEGFGDETDFWIGLKAINSLTGSSPRLLRIEAVTWSGVLYISEYSGFTVGDASTAYTMKFSSYLGGSSNTTADSLLNLSGRKFSTIDRDSGGTNCPRWRCGKSGWWFSVDGNCTYSNPNGVYKQYSATNDLHNMFLYGADSYQALKSIRLMLQV